MNRVEFLKRKYIGKEIKRKQNYLLTLDDELVVSEKTFYKIYDADPTRNKKYIFWLLNIYCHGHLPLEDLVKANEYLKYLNKYNNKLKEDKRNIANYKNLEDLYDELEFLMEMSEDDLMSGEEYLKKIKEKDVEVVYDDKDWKIVVPLTQETSNIYGRGTQWCTTSEKGSRFEDYTKKQYPGAKLYIIIDKNALVSETKTHKHQFHFESKQFKDASNKDVDINVFFEKNKKTFEVLSSMKNSFGLYLRVRFGISNFDGIVIDGDFNLNGFDIQENVVLENIVVNGNMYANGSKIKRIKNIHVNGDIQLLGSNIQHFEGKLYVGGSLWASGSILKTLPDDSVIKRTAKLQFSKLENFPKNIEVGHNCYISGTNIKHISVENNIKIGKNLYINGLNIKRGDVKLKYIGGEIFDDDVFEMKF